MFEAVFEGSLGDISARQYGRPNIYNNGNQRARRTRGESAQ